MHPEVAPIRELRHALGQLRLNSLAVGPDGRNRVLLSAFQARTGRNQPSNSQFIFGPACWLRPLIRPEPGKAIAYVDWSAQEIGIAAALSGDVEMQHAYSSGDPYLWLAKSGGYAPGEATKQSHAPVRDTFKVVYFAANYGMGEHSLSQLLGRPAVYARALLQLHRRCFPTFWRWSDGAVCYGMLYRRLWTVFGWTLHVGSVAKLTSLRNFPVQANGAEMLRLACCLATERGISVCAPVHDALLVEAPLNEIEAVVAETQQAMREASEAVLGGFSLGADAKIIRFPDRYSDPRGSEMWKRVMDILAHLPETNLVGIVDKGAKSRRCTVD
jgi:DNA polymerase I